MAAAQGGRRFLDCARRSRRAWMADWRRLGPTVRWRRRLRRTMADPLPDDGAGTRVRTGDLLLTRRLLYQLSYSGSLPGSGSQRDAVVLARRCLAFYRDRQRTRLISRPYCLSRMSSSPFFKLLFSLLFFFS